MLALTPHVYYRNHLRKDNNEMADEEGVVTARKQKRKITEGIMMKERIGGKGWGCKGERQADGIDRAGL